MQNFGGIKLWQIDCLLRKNVGKLVNFGKILANGIYFAKFAKVFPCQNFVLYGISNYIMCIYIYTDVAVLMHTFTQLLDLCDKIKTQYQSESITRSYLFCYSSLRLLHMILWHQLIITLIHHWYCKEEGIHEGHKTLGLVSPPHGIH